MTSDAATTRQVSHRARPAMRRWETLRGGYVWRASCECGRYKTRSYEHPGRAERALAAHVRSGNGGVA